MNYQDTLLAMRKKSEESINIIGYFTEHKQMGEFTKWLLETDINPYEFTLNGIVDTKNCFSVHHFLSMIHHAIVDDGDVCFPIVRGLPRIVFHDEWDVKENPELAISKEFDLNNTTVEGFIDSIEDFPEEFEKYHHEYLKKSLEFSIKVKKAVNKLDSISREDVFQWWSRNERTIKALDALGIY